MAAARRAVDDGPRSSRRSCRGRQLRVRALARRGEENRLVSLWVAARRGDENRLVSLWVPARRGDGKKTAGASPTHRMFIATATLARDQSRRLFACAPRTPRSREWRRASRTRDATRSGTREPRGTCRRKRGNARQGTGGNGGFADRELLESQIQLGNRRQTRRAFGSQRVKLSRRRYPFVRCSSRRGEPPGSEEGGHGRVRRALGSPRDCVWTFRSRAGRLALSRATSPRARDASRKT